LGALPGIAELAGMAVLCAMAIRYRPTAEAALAAIAYGGALLAIVGWRQQGLHGDLFLLVLGVAFAVTIATGVYMRSIEQRRAEVARATRQSERDAIARELHDVVAHTVSAMTVQAGLAIDALDSRPEVARAAMRQVRASGKEAVRELRATVGVLRADGVPRTDPAPRLAQLDELVERVRATGLSVSLHADTGGREPPQLVELAAYRIVQEALTNVIKHADARHVAVSVGTDGDRVTVEVTDDGTAQSTVQGDGFGLIGMRERAAAAGGGVEAGPVPGGGWRVHATLPVDGGAA